MRSIFLGLATALMLAAATSASAQTPQEAYSGDAGITYHWVHTNAGPGECGCFGLNGAGITGSWNVHAGWSAVAEVSSEFRGSTSQRAIADGHIISRWRSLSSSATVDQRPASPAALRASSDRPGAQRRRRSRQRRSHLRIRRARRRRHRHPAEISLRSSRDPDRLVPHAIRQRQK